MSSLLADENIHPRLLDALRSAEHDLTSIIEAGLSGADDEEVPALANLEGRILITFVLEGIKSRFLARTRTIDLMSFQSGESFGNP